MNNEYSAYREGEKFNGNLRGNYLFILNFYRVLLEDLSAWWVRNQLIEVGMDSTDDPFIPSRSVWYAIVYDRQRRKRDYLDGFDTIEQAQIWLLRNLASGERGEVKTGHTLRATGDARYYKEGQRLLMADDETRAGKLPRWPECRGESR